MARGTGVKVLPRGIEKDKMGLGIHVSGMPPKAGLLSRRPDPEMLLRQIDGAIEEAVTDPVQKLLMVRGIADDVLYLRLHPGEEDISFTLEDGRVVATAKTSSAGPGYHAMLVDLLDEIGQRTGIAWSWEDKGEGDETGYQQHRNIKKLRGAMADWLKTLAGSVLAEAPVGHPVRLNLPPGKSAVVDSFAVAPMGALSREWLERVAAGNKTTLAKEAEAFYPAWHKPNRAEYWANCGRYLMLWELDWVRPDNPEAHQRYETALGCFARAREIDPAFKVPEAELREAWDLLNGDAPDATPRPGGIGFRRGLMERLLAGRWTASIPGYFRAEPREDGGDLCTAYSFGPREVEATVTTLDEAEEGDAAANFIEQHAGQDQARDILVFQPAREQLMGRAVSKEEEPGVTTVYGMVGTGTEVCFVNLRHESGDEGRQWAATVLASVSLLPPEPTAVAAEAEEPADSDSDLDLLLESAGSPISVTG